MATAVVKDRNAKQVFVISPIGPAGSPVRRQADLFLDYIVRRALPYESYEVERADEHDSPLAITAAMLHSIMTADICVADITGRNPNVMYELAIAHAMDKHVIIMDSDSGPSPFDIQDMRAIPYGLMPDEVEQAVQQLRQKATHKPSKSAFKDMMNPVAVAFRKWTEQQQAQTSGSSSEQVLMRMVERLEEKVDRAVMTQNPAAVRPLIPTAARPLNPFSTDAGLVRQVKEFLPVLDAYVDRMDQPPQELIHLAVVGRSLADDPRTTSADLREWLARANDVIPPGSLGARRVAGEAL